MMSLHVRCAECTAHRKAAHKGLLWGMFVQPDWRRERLGERLLQAAIDHARVLGGISTLQLSVSEAAGTAQRLYERLGFTVWGVEPDAMQFEGRFVADYHMLLRLS
ncbi:MAG TPA: GNAT family N-acetyltransferase [Steroidobacteraceae bacterium]|nr:GNAT family N-acetyltransferase [Steroidobacteraceae bacterium]